MRTILVGYDLTDPSKRALERAAALAGVFDARLIVTSVVPGRRREIRDAIAVDPADRSEPRSDELAHARAYLDAQGVKAGYVRATGEAARMITEVADVHDADLIVLGTRAPGLPEAVVRPSVSRAVARRAQRDVMIVHPD